MNGPALAATLTVHAGLWGLLNFLPQKAAAPAKIIQPISVVYRKPAPPPEPIALPAPPPAPKRRRRAAAKAPPVEKIPPSPPALLTAPAAPSEAAAAAVVVPAAATPATTDALPQLTEQELPEGYVEENGFSFAPLYRVTQPPKLLQALKLQYPARAKEFQKEGTVILEVDIDARGRVLSARIIEESGWGFGEAALNAVLHAEFSPARIDSTAVPIRYRIPIRFQMDFS